MNFSLLKSKTFWGALATCIGAVSQCDWSHGIPYVCIVTAAGALLGVIGIRDAIAGNGSGASAADADKANGVAK